MPHDKEYYRLAVYFSGVELIPYSNQHVKDQLVPDVIEVTSVILDRNKKYVVSVTDDFKSAIGIIKEFEINEWMRLEIDQVRMFNNKLKNKHGNARICRFPPPDFVIIDPLKWDLICSAVDLIGRYPLLTGPTGCGKTQMAKAIAKATGRKYYYLNAGGLQKPKATLIGSMQAKDGSTFLVKSEFLTYYTSDEPVLIFIDELSRISSMGANYMMTILDREESYIYSDELGERIYIGKDVVFIAAANFGIQYSDTRKLDDALLNRFIPFHLNYLLPDDEIRLINMKILNLNQTDLAKLIKQANLLRANFDTLGTEISHRHTIDWAAFLSIGFPWKVVQNELLVNLFLNGNDDRRDQANQILNAQQP